MKLKNYIKDFIKKLLNISFEINPLIVNIEEI